MASFDNNVTATYSVEVYQGRAYVVTTAPSLGGTIGKASNSVLEERFAQTKAVVEVQTSMYAGYKSSVELPVKNVKINKTNSTVTFDYDINGLKSSDHELYYDRKNPDADKATDHTAAYVSESAYTTRKRYTIFAIASVLLYTIVTITFWMENQKCRKFQ